MLIAKCNFTGLNNSVYRTDDKVDKADIDKNYSDLVKEVPDNYFTEIAREEKEAKDFDPLAEEMENPENKVMTKKDLKTKLK